MNTAMGTKTTIGMTMITMAYNQSLNKTIRMTMTGMVYKKSLTTDPMQMTRKTSARNNPIQL